MLCFLPSLCYSVELNDREKKESVYALYEEYKKDFPLVKDISPQEAIEKFRSGEQVIFVDVREPEEIAVSALPRSITREAYLESAEKYHGYQVIAYCTISYRSGLFAVQLSEQGRFVYNLKGGILGWVHEGGPIYADGRKASRLHVYGEKWDIAPADIETVTFSFWQQLLL